MRSSRPVRATLPAPSRAVSAARLGAAVVVALALSGCGPTLRAWWPMDEAAGPTVVDDAGDHDGTATDVAFGQPGQLGSAYGFNGTTSIVNVPPSDDLNPGAGSFSYSAWVSFDELPPPATWDVLRKGLISSTGGYYKLELYTVNTSSARARCHFRDGSGVGLNVGGGNNLQDGRWHHLVCSRSGDTFTLEVDGVVVRSTSASLGSIANTAGLTMGAKSSESDVFKGRIDDVRMTFG